MSKINLGGTTDTTVHFQHDGSMVVEEKQDCQAILDSNQRSRDHRFSSVSPGGFAREEFEIPMILLWRWHLECGHRVSSQEFEDYMNAKLKEPEFKYLISAPKHDPHIIITGAR